MTLEWFVWLAVILVICLVFIYAARKIVGLGKMASLVGGTIMGLIVACVLSII